MNVLSRDTSMYLLSLCCNMRTTARLIANGKVTIPIDIRDELGLADGDLVELDIRPVDDFSEGIA